jgi:2'-5' RNA ligase
MGALDVRYTYDMSKPNATFTQKYALVQFVKPPVDGFEYPSSDWPLHVTVLDTFKASWTSPQIIAHMQKALHSHKPFTVHADETRFFGETGDIEVTLVDRSSQLMNLHTDLLNALKGGGLVLNDPQFAGEGFLPHATVQKDARLVAGEAFTFYAISLVDMFPDDDAYKRRVIDTVDLGG